MITPSFSLTATERVLPRLALDFLTASLDSRVSVSRALNTATRINSSGLVEIVNANLPRFDFDPVTLACKGLLIEETRVNYCTYSEDFSNTDWAKQSSGTGTAPNLTSNYAVAPDGTQTADRLIFDIGAGTAAGDTSKVTHAAFTGLTNPHASSVGIWFKSNTSNSYVVQLADGYVASTTVTVTPTWQRFTFSNASVSGTQSNLFFGLQGNQGTAKYADISVWGAQFEVGAFATSYIPNLATGTTTRNADAVSMTGTNFSDWYNATEGTLQVIGSMNTASTSIFQTFAMIGDANNSLQIFNNLSASRFRGDIYSGGAIQKAFTYTAAGAPASGTTYNIIVGLKANDFAMAINGNTVATANSGLMPVSPSALYIGSVNTGAQQIGGYIRKLTYYNQKLTNSEIQAFSK